MNTNTMQLVVNRAVNLCKKYKKSDALSAIRELAAMVDGEDDLAVKNLAILYQLLVPQTVPGAKKHLSDFEWCALAVADKRDLRHYLCHVYVTDTHIIGCNGASLHRAPNPGLEPGYYLPNGDKIDLDAQYPDTDRVIPTKGLSAFDISSPEYVESDKILAATFGDYAINKTYLDKAMRCNGAMQSAKADLSLIRREIKNKGPLRIDFDGDRLAVIMPMRI